MPGTLTKADPISANDLPLTKLGVQSESILTTQGAGNQTLVRLGRIQTEDYYNRSSDIVEHPLEITKRTVEPDNDVIITKLGNFQDRYMNERRRRRNPSTGDDTILQTRSRILKHQEV